jgi:hypothetical protein
MQHFHQLNRFQQTEQMSSATLMLFDPEFLSLICPSSALTKIKVSMQKTAFSVIVKLDQLLFCVSCSLFYASDNLWHSHMYAKIRSDNKRVRSESVVS